MEADPVTETVCCVVSRLLEDGTSPKPHTFLTVAVPIVLYIQLFQTFIFNVPQVT
jgi:hypothetical protein